jgi:hypothetical protein
MSVNIIKAGRIVRTSKNLRGVLDYARVSPVRRVETTPLPAGAGSLRVLYRDGAETRANFASYEVMLDWVKRRRSWAGAAFVNY